MHVALVSAYPRESEARVGIARDLDSPALGEYRGVWRTPTGAIVHLFSDLATEELNRNGLILVSSALPDDADASFLIPCEDAKARSARRCEPHTAENGPGVGRDRADDPEAAETRSSGWGDYPLSETYPGSGIYE